VLSIPVDAQRQDTRARGNFGKWMINHIDSWFTFARRLGLGIERMEEIVLVTGSHLTRSWANVAFFEGQTNGQASLGVNVTHGPDMSIHWQCSPGSVRGGVRSWGPEGKVCWFAETLMAFSRSFPLFRIYQKINAYLYEVSELLVSSGYYVGSSEEQLDPIRCWTWVPVMMSLTQHLHRLARRKR
jgi:hypothetical protein